MRRSVRFAVALLAATAASGCGLAQLHTGKTTPKGTTDVLLAVGAVKNGMVDERGFAVTNFPVHVAVRYGATEKLDVGASMFMASGLLADAKYNLVDPGARYAISVLGGAGAGAELGDLLGGHSRTRWALHVPVSIIGSYEAVKGILTPYVSAGYGAYWIFGYEPVAGVDAKVLPGERLARRAGYGDGLLTVRVGLEAKLPDGNAFVFEYGLLNPVVDDPGDGFSFATNHVLALGFRI